MSFMKKQYEKWIRDLFIEIDSLFSDNINLLKKSDYYNNVYSIIEVNNIGIINLLKELKDYINKYLEIINNDN